MVKKGKVLPVQGICSLLGIGSVNNTIRGIVKRFFTRCFNSNWLPALLHFFILILFVISAIPVWKPLLITGVLMFVMAVTFLGLVVTFIQSLIKKRWERSILQLLQIIVCGLASIWACGLVLFTWMFVSDEDTFADNLTIPEGIEIAEPVPDQTAPWGGVIPEERDSFQEAIRMALSIPGNNDEETTPSMPSLRKASTDNFAKFLEYLEASPDWHVFPDRGNRFASRRWSYGGEPRDTLHGYISDFSDSSRFQTRCLICLDRAQWSRYSVQHVEEGTTPVKPKMSKGNDMHESRIMIECGGVWVEIFEQSNNLERRITKAIMTNLEKEFSEFLNDPEAAVAEARTRSKRLSSLLAGDDDQPIKLLVGMQPGIYGVVYNLNPGEPGSVYLKAFEVTQGTQLSAVRLEDKSRTRMTWSEDPAERFGAKAGFTIYEGDWGQPYAARFEVWFTPDSGEPDRKLAERIFKIEGWMR